MKPFRVIIIIFIIFLISGCSFNKLRSKELENQALIDAGINEVEEEEQHKVVQTLLNLDETLNELDKALQGETGEIYASMAETNLKLIVLQKKLTQIEADLNNVAVDIKTLRLERIEPVVQDTLDKMDQSP